MAMVYGRRAALIRTRLREEHETQFESLAPLPTEELAWLRRWLYVAGFRRPSAPAAFVAAALTALFAGIAVATGVAASEALHQTRVWLYDLPGNMGSLIDPLVLLTPWLL